MTDRSIPVSRAATRSGLTLVCLAATLAFSDRARAGAPSFDCNRAQTEIEHTICVDPRLSTLDGVMGAAYQDRLAASGNDASIRQEQRQWLNRVLSKCDSASDCLKRAYLARIRELRSGQAIPDSSPVERRVSARGVVMVEPLKVGEEEVLPAGPLTTDIEPLFDRDLFDVQLQPESEATQDTKGMGGMVKTCRDFRRLGIEGWYAGDGITMRGINYVNLNCRLFELLKSGRAAKISYLPERNMGDIRLYSPLILLSGPPMDGSSTEELMQSLGWAGKTISDLELQAIDQLVIRNEPSYKFNNFDDYYANDNSDLILKDSSPYIASYIFGGSNYYLDVLAVGDFTNDGIETFLTIFHSEPVLYVFAGQQTTTEPFLVTRLPDTRAIRPIDCGTRRGIYCLN